MARALLEDIRFGLRTIRNAPWLSSVTVLTLALGIGASVAMLGVLHGTFLSPLPFPEADRLVVGRATVRGELNPWVAGADYYDYHRASDAFENLAATLPFSMDITVSGEGDAERVVGSVVSDNLLAALGVRPMLGQGFRPEDGEEGAENVAMLSYGFWQRRMGADPEVVGSAVTLDGAPYTVVGVLPRDFHFMTRAEIWLPMRPDRYAAAARDAHNWYLVGRLKPGTNLTQAQADIDVISARLQQAYPESNQDKGLRLTGLREVLTEDYRQSLWILSGAVALLLLIACGNGAGILLARAPARRFELSVRTAVGAGRGRLVRQLLAESLSLALAAGILGSVLAMWFQHVMLGYLRMDRLGLEVTGLTLPILPAALGVSLLAGLMAGTYPALKSTDTALAQGLRTGGRGAGDGGTGFRTGLVVTQVALSVLLLTGSGLLVRSLWNLEALDPGFRAQGLVTAEFQIPLVRYASVEARQQFFGTLLEEARAMPGVESATLTSHLPIGDFGNIYRANAQGREEDVQRVFLRAVFPESFETLGIPRFSGRELDDAAAPDGPYEVILSQTAAARLFPGEDPLGRVVEFGTATGPRPLEVVGVVGDVRLSRLEEEPEAALYVPYTQHPRNVMRLVLRTRTPPESVAVALKEILRRYDPEVPLSRVVTLESLVSSSMADRRVITLSLTFLAALPLLLASVGLFAILAYHVSRRRREMGVRMALGASAGQVGSIVLRQGMGVVAAGVLGGMGGAVVGTRVLRSMLFGVDAMDPWTFLTVVGLVSAVALVACSLPVWRAARSDPRIAIEAD
jgi:putative ABC transport system permease protein